MEGALAAGGGTGFAGRLLIFLVLAGVLGLCAFMPNMLMKRPNLSAEDAAPVAPTAAPVAGPAAQAISASRPPMAPPPKRPGKP